MTLICISLIENSAAKFTIAAGECKAKGADLVEIRLDYLTEPLSINVLKRLAKIKDETGLPEILTFRPDWEGGKFDRFEERRLDIIENGINLGFDYIDLELKTDQKIENCKGSRGDNNRVISQLQAHSHLERNPQ